MNSSKRSFSNREHQVFLIAGGIIFALILVVATFSTFRSGTDRSVLQEVKQQPVVDPSFRPIQSAQESHEIMAKAWNQGETSPATTDSSAPGTAKPTDEKNDKAASVFSYNYATPTLTAPTESSPKPAVAPLTTKPVPSAKQATAEEGTAPAPFKEAPAISKEKESFAVQLGAYSDSANAAEIAKQVADISFNGQRLTAYQSPIVTQGTTYYRVRLGPFPTRHEADQVMQLVKHKFGKVASVVPAWK